MKITSGSDIETVLNLPEGIKPTKVVRGPRSGEIIVFGFGLNACIIKDINNPDDPGMKVTEMLGTEYFSTGLGIIDLAFDRSIKGIKVAVVSSSENQLHDPDRTLKVKFSIFYSFDRFPKKWYFYHRYDHPSDDPNLYCEMGSFVVPLMSFPVVRDGVFIISLANRADKTLSFLKIDFAEDIKKVSSARFVAPFAAVMRDARSTRGLFKEVIGIVAQNAVENADGTQKIIEPGHEEYERARKVLCVKTV